MTTAFLTHGKHWNPTTVTLETKDKS